MKSTSESVNQKEYDSGYIAGSNQERNLIAGHLRNYAGRLFAQHKDEDAKRIRFLAEAIEEREEDKL